MIRRYTSSCFAIIIITINYSIIVAACLATSPKRSFPGSIRPIIAIVRRKFRTYFIAIISMNIMSEIVQIDRMK